MNISENNFYCFFLFFNGNNKQFEIIDDSFNSVVNAISEEFYDIFYEILKETPSYKKAKGNNFIWEDIYDVYKVCEEKFERENIEVYNKKGELSNIYSLSKVYKILIEDYVTDENGDIAICSLWSNQLNNFIKEGCWNVALMSNDGDYIKDIKDWPARNISGNHSIWERKGKTYKPIMWYGIKNKEILNEWIVENEGLQSLVPEEHGMGGYGGQMRINGLEINYMHLFTENDGSWYFGACGEEGADFHKVIETCPIDLPSLYSNKNGDIIIEDYCVNLQKQLKQ